MKQIYTLILVCICMIACQQRPQQQTNVDLEHYDLPQIKDSGVLVALTLNSSISYFDYRGEPMGFQYELAKQFAQSLGLKLEIKTAKNIEGGNPAQQQGSVGNHFLLGVEKGHQLRGKDDNRSDQRYRGGDRHQQGSTNAFSGTIRLIGTQILTDKGGDSQTKGLNRKEDHLIDLQICGPAGHKVVTEMIDVGLDKHIGKGCDTHLHGSGDTNYKYLFQHQRVYPQISQ